MLIKKESMFDWNNTAAPFPEDKCVHELFEARVAERPHSVALTFGNLSLSYQELNQRANQLAHYLQSLGVGPETLVAIFVERSVEMVVGVLGILKAGGAYVPLDPAYPQERLGFMMEDCQASVLLTQSNLLDLLPDHDAQTIFLDTDWEQIATHPIENLEDQGEPKNLAYVIYTSGTTGKPKGVMVEHKGLTNLAVEHKRIYRIKTNSRVLQFASLSFDVSFCEFFMALAHGATLCLGTLSELMPGKPLIEFLQKNAITHAPLIPSALAVTPKVDLPDLEVLIVGSEALPRKLAETWSGDYLFLNLYGLTETTIDATYAEVTPSDQNPPIGRPLANYLAYILDENMQPVEVGESGELFIGGVGVARGYLNRPKETKARFLADPFVESPEARMYRTGDLVRYRADGNIEFLGRIDQQVKVRGFRIELGEIESALEEHDDVQQAIVVAATRNRSSDEKRLIAYLVKKNGHQLSTKSVRQYITSRLPNYMVPSVIMEVDFVPLMPNGKIDFRALPEADTTRPELEQAYVAPKSQIEKSLAEIWAALLSLDKVGMKDNFFDLGGTSLLSVQLATRIQDEFDIEMPLVKVFQFPNIDTLAGYLRQEIEGSVSSSGSQRIKVASASKSAWDYSDKEIQQGVAIVGMACRFPGADSPDEFWQNLRDGNEAISFFANEELAEEGKAQALTDADYVFARGIIEDEDKFDAQFFGFNPRMAETMDPQQRVFLEIAWAALEDAGCDPGRYEGLIGVYAGLGFNTYYTNNVLAHPDVMEILGETQVAIGNEKDFLPTLVSYKLNLTGPSININTACSTSLVAVAQAFHGLISHQCDMALAGGVSIPVPQRVGYLYQEGGMLSRDGHTRPFDAQATGTIFGSGAGIVTLKRLQDAFDDGNQIYAVIRGVGLNNDGADKVSFTAPSVNGQAAAIAEAQANAGFHPETISYIETHGTGTPLGDPIEIEALKQVFQAGTENKNFCAIGSVKSNIGHAVAAAGVAGLIKTALSLKHKTLPPSLFFESPNPRIDFDNSPFYVNSQMTTWDSTVHPRRAGVSSFGVGGTNAHVVLEEAPEAPQVDVSHPSRLWKLFLLSGKTKAVLDQATSDLADFLKAEPSSDLADAAFTLQTGRSEFEHRRAIVCKEAEDAIQALETRSPKWVVSRTISPQTPDLGFMFPGQGSQRVNMGRDLYLHEPLFKQVVDQCAEILEPILDRDIREVLYPSQGDEKKNAALLRETYITQPAIFIIEYALAKLWMSWGTQPAIMVGHSIGEFTAACLAGVFSLEDVLKLVASRGQLMQDLPPGSMLSVRKPASQVSEYLEPGIDLAADNGPALCVVSGPSEAINDLADRLETDGIACSRLHTSHAFHSAMMDPIIEPFTDQVRVIKLSTPQIPILSTVTGEMMTVDQATDPRYWASHLRATVRFTEAVARLWGQPGRTLLEVGPGKTLATLARQQIQDNQIQSVIASLDIKADHDSEWPAMMMAIGQLWLAGLPIDWEKFYQGEKMQRISLPSYPFERQRYWLEPASPSAPMQAAVEQPLKEGLAMTPQQTDLPKISRKEHLIPLVIEVFQDTLGLEMDGVDNEITFLDIGLDSLSLTQVAIALKNKFKVKFTFRQLLEEYANFDSLATVLDEKLPEGKFEPQPPQPTIAPPAPQGEVAPMTPAQAQGTASMPLITVSGQISGDAEQIIHQQLQIMSRQLEVLGLAGVSPQQYTQQIGTAPPIEVPDAKSAERKQESEDKPASSARYRRISTQSDQDDPALEAKLKDFVDKYNLRTQKSKAATQQHRPHLADPPTVTGFSPKMKELVYPINIERSAGSKLWDVDGNEYVDLLNGFGSNFFGFTSPFIVQAIEEQLQRGMEIGPQNPLAGEVAKLFSQVVNLERVSFCLSGTEAVMGAVRLARTVTGRDTVVIFDGSYHGHTDEFTVRSIGKNRSMPAAPGIPNAKVENLVVLEYGTDESLEIIKNQAEDLAAVIVEPIQSRRPDFQPREFLHKLREITKEADCALIFDEVITGFRVHPGGAQAYFGVQADLATYGKIIGGGLPIGVIAGSAEFMDAFDGGFWQFGDDSIPEAGVTYYAGTFFRYPLALASAKAALEFIIKEGPELQATLNAKADQFVSKINSIFRNAGVPFEYRNFGSMMYLFNLTDLPYGQLLIYWLRYKGVHIWDDLPCFFTIVHSDEDIEFVVNAFEESIQEMKQAGFLGSGTSDRLGEQAGDSKSGSPPVPGARLGKDPQGNPAWYAEDPDRPGKYKLVGEVTTS